MRTGRAPTRHRRHPKCGRQVPRTEIAVIAVAPRIRAADPEPQRAVPPPLAVAVTIAFITGADGPRPPPRRP